MTREEILKTEAIAEYKKQRKEEKDENSHMSEKEFEKYIAKKYNKPISMISNTPLAVWMLISPTKERAVDTIHFSFGYRLEDKPIMWMEIALNDVESVRKFLALTKKEDRLKLYDLSKSLPENMMFYFADKLKDCPFSSPEHKNIELNPMCNLTDERIENIRAKARNIDNQYDPLHKTYIALCHTENIKPEDMVDYIKKAYPIYKFITNIKTRQDKCKDLRDNYKTISLEFEQENSEIESLTKQIDRMKSIEIGKQAENLKKSKQQLKDRIEKLEELKRRQKELKSQIDILEQDMCSSQKSIEKNS